jgi:hypothetical protein
MIMLKGTPFENILNGKSLLNINIVDGIVDVMKY